MTASIPATATQPSSTAGREYRFGAFVLMPDQRRLLSDGAQVRLTRRAFDLLVTLVEGAGRVISHHQLIASAWPNSVVEEVNLRVHISALRTALRRGGGVDRHIDNIPGQGYCFVAPVTVRHPSAQALPPLALVGRDSECARLVADLRVKRFISLVGTGGVGKTALAGAVAAELAGQDGVRVHRVDLSVLDDGDTPQAALARTAGLSLAGALEPGPVLVVLDHCEYRLHEAAALAEALLERFPRLMLLASSREPLLAEGETLFRPSPLTLPQPEQPAAEALTAPALALFMRSARANAPDLVLGDDDVADLAVLCRHLDGLPLALELYAGLVGSLGVRAVARACPAHALAAEPAPRPPRQHSLWASLGWSFQRLPLREQVVLRRLAAFRHAFSLGDAMRMVDGAQLSPSALLEILIALVAKSLISVAPGPQGTQYRLLNTTRSFAFEKLCAAGERHLRGAAPQAVLSA